MAVWLTVLGMAFIGLAAALTFLLVGIGVGIGMGNTLFPQQSRSVCQCKKPFPMPLHSNECSKQPKYAEYLVLLQGTKKGWPERPAPGKSSTTSGEWE